MITETELEVMYVDMLDCEGPVNIAGISMDISGILKECDPIAYNVGMSDYASSLIDDGETVEGY